MSNRPIYLNKEAWRAICAISGCGREATNGDVCNRCYQGIRRAIDKGLTTEDELLDRGIRLRSETVVQRFLKTIKVAG